MVSFFISLIVFIVVTVLSALLFVLWVVRGVSRGVFRMIVSRQRPRRVLQMSQREVSELTPCPRETCRNLNPSAAQFCRRCGQSLDPRQTGVAMRRRATRQAPRMPI